MPQLDDLMAQLEKRYGRRLPPGYNPNLKFMSHLWEPLRHIYRWVVLNVEMLYQLLRQRQWLPVGMAWLIAVQRVCGVPAAACNM